MGAALLRRLSSWLPWSRRSEGGKFDPSKVEDVDRLATNWSLYRCARGSGSADDCSLIHCDGVLPLSYDARRSAALATYLKGHWRDGKLVLQATTKPRHPAQTVSSGWRDAFDYTAAGPGRADAGKQAKETCSLAGSALTHARNGGMPGLDHLLNHAEHHCQDLPCAAGMSVATRRVDTLLQRGRLSDDSSNFGWHQDIWSWMGSHSERERMADITMVYKLSAGRSGMQILGADVHEYGTDAGAVAVFPAAAWHRSVSAESDEGIFKVTVFLSLVDTRYWTSFHVPLEERGLVDPLGVASRAAGLGLLPPAPALASYRVPITRKARAYALRL